MTSIEQMLHRRNDLSTFLVHFTRNGPGYDALTALWWILSTGQIEARTPYGLAASHPDPAIRESQQVVCFTETPLEHSWTMLQELTERRAMTFAPCGIAFTKTYARRQECNPVWYANHTPGYNWPTHALNAAVAAETRPPTDRNSIFRVTPFMEQMGTWPAGRKEFWWEREWRRVGHFKFTAHHVVAVLAPAETHQNLQSWINTNTFLCTRPTPLPILDPSWGLERMIAALSGVDQADIGPFP